MSHSRTAHQPDAEGALTRTQVRPRGHGGHGGPLPAARAQRAILGWTVRLVRRGALVLAASAAGYMVLEVASFRQTYPDGVSAEQFTLFADDPASRMLQGVPHGIETAGGFAAWDGGWVLEIIVGLWALLVVTRLLRGEEEAQRAEMLLAGPVRAGRATALQLLVVVAAALLTGAAVAAALVGTGSDAGRSALFGVGIAGVALTFAGVGAVTAQVFDTRRLASGTAAAALFGSLLLRMAANSTDDRAWLGWFTPFGWVDLLEPFGDPSLGALVPLALVPAILLGVAVRIRGRRDAGGALVATSDSHAPRLRGLGGPAAFAWRSNRAVLLGWVLGLGTYAFVIGSLVPTMVEFLAQDADYRRVLAELGLSAAVTVQGFLGVMGITLGVGFALYAAWRMGAVRVEEGSGRAENVLTRPVTRSRWLAGHAAVALAGAGLLTVLTGVAMWAGAAAAGSSEVTAGDALRSVLNTGSVTVLVTGLAMLTFGLLPRLTLAVPVAVTVVGYLLSLLGPALSWPAWVVDLSPFAHLALVPAESFAAGPATAMVALGLAGVGAGLVAFSRRDLVGD